MSVGVGGVSVECRWTECRVPVILEVAPTHCICTGRTAITASGGAYRGPCSCCGRDPCSCCGRGPCSCCGHGPYCGHGPCCGRDPCCGCGPWAAGPRRGCGPWAQAQAAGPRRGCGPWAQAQAAGPRSGCGRCWCCGCGPCSRRDWANGCGHRGSVRSTCKV
eukprot:gene3725-biopygen5280